MKTQKNQKGFTLIELIVVVAIIGIIGAALVPQFATMSKRAKMSTDVSTVKTAQGQVEVYYQDMGTWPGADYGEVMSNLVSNSYLDSRYLSSGELLIQTESATVEWDDSTHKLALSVTADDLSLYNKKADKDQGWIK